MARVSPDVLAACLAGLESGRFTIDECLAAHAAVAVELRALLSIAGSIPTTAPIEPDPTFRVRGRAALIQTIVEQQTQRRTWGQRLFGVDHSQTRRPIMQRLAMPLASLAMVGAVTIASGGGVVLAAQSALPGDALYPVKTTVQELQVALVPGNEAKAQAFLELASQRVADIEEARQLGRAGATSAAAEAFSSNVAEAERHIAQAQAAGRDVRALSALLGENLGRHQSVLAKAATNAPAPAKAVLDKAAQAAQTRLAAAGEVVPGNAKTKDQDASEAAAVISVDQTISRVQQLAADDTVSGQSYEGLLAKLRAADAAIGRGQSDVAARTLDAFLNDLNAMQRAGHISQQNYEELYGNYSLAVRSLGGTPQAANGSRSSGGGEQPATPEAARRGAEDANDKSDQRSGPDPRGAPGQERAGQNPPRK